MKKTNLILLLIVFIICSCSEESSDDIDDIIYNPEDCVIGNNYDYDCD